MSQRAEPTTEELDAVRMLCDGEVSYRTEGWRQFVHMEGLRIGTLRVNGLLGLNHDNPTYPTKLYLSENVGGPLNWNEQPYLMGQQWHTFSWANVPNTLPIVEILAAHLAPIMQGKAA